MGIAASKQNEEEFLFTTLCGVVYSPDSVHLYPRYSTVTEEIYPNAKYVTSGIDEQTTYGVQEDPFHKGVLLLLNTDLGLIRSEDNGSSWSRANIGIPNKWVNTVYDVIFDERRENYVYSVWSGRHDAPYNPTNETDNRNGGFAISKDGGKTWDATYSSGLPENVIPVKMGIIYPDDTIDAIIYVATFNEGFFVSYDSGKTFIPMNDGLNRVSYKDEDGYQYILASDIEVKEGHIFGITAKNAYANLDTRQGELFEYVNGKWHKIPLPKNVKTPRDIYYHDGVLYISGVATPVWEYQDGVDFTNYGGGVYAYQNGKFTQIFDESISTTSVQIDQKETIYISDINGNIYRKEKNKNYEKIYDSFFYISKGLQLSNDGDYLYLATFGGGLLKLENLNSLYHHVCTGGIATCLKRAICEICGKEYGKLDLMNHELSTTHIINQKAPTYDEEGYTGDIVYDCCNAIKEKGKIIPRLHQEHEENIIPGNMVEHQEETNDNIESIKTEVLNNYNSSNNKISNQNETSKDDTIGESISSDKKQDSTTEKKQPSTKTESNNSNKKISNKKFVYSLLIILLILLVIMTIVRNKLKKSKH